MEGVAYAAGAPESDGLAGWVVALMDRLGGPGAGIAIAAENVFPPLPSEMILPLAGFAAARGRLTLVEAIGWTTAGSVIGALLLYLLGVTLGRDRLHRIAERMPLVSSADLTRSEEWFDRHGYQAVLIGRVIPLVRSLVSVPAGVARMPIGRFILLTALGSGFWNSVLILAGYHLGHNWDAVSEYASRYQLVILAVAGVAVAVWLTRRIRARDS